MARRADPGRAEPCPETGKIEAKQLALALADILDEKQADEITILDVSGPLAIADYFVIATTRNQRHAESLARELIPFAKSQGITNRHVSGTDSDCGWVLLDFDLVVVHLFDAERRAFYALDDLWGDVPRLEFTPRERLEGEAEPVIERADAFPTGWPEAFEE